jgi:hypothetical protein
MTTHPPKQPHTGTQRNVYTAEAELCGDLSSRPRTAGVPSMTVAYVPVVRKTFNQKNFATGEIESVTEVILTVPLAMTYNRALRCAYIMATRESNNDPGSMVL